MNADVVKYLIVQMTELEYYKIRKMIDDYNKHRDLCRRRYETKDEMRKDKSNEFQYPKIILELPIKRLILPTQPEYG